MWLSKKHAISLAAQVIDTVADNLNVLAGVAESDGEYYYVWQAPNGGQLYYPVNEETILLQAKNLNQSELMKYIKFSLFVRYNDGFWQQDTNWNDDDWNFFSNLRLYLNIQ